MSNPSSETSGKSLSSQQQRAIRAMLTARTVEDAAKAADVSRATLHRWLADATFCAELRHAETEALTAVTRRLISLALDAAQVLDDILNEPSSKKADQLRAADIALSKVLQLRQLSDHESRLAAIEATMEAAMAKETK